MAVVTRDETRHGIAHLPRVGSNQRCAYCSVDSPAAGLTPTPGSPRPAPVPERTQPQPCFLPGCPWQGGVDEVVGHARERHASLIAPGGVQRLVVPLVDDQVHIAVAGHDRESRVPRRDERNRLGIKTNAANEEAVKAGMLHMPALV